MARPRKPRSAKTHAAYLRRNARARSLGYKNYYDYRVHDNGRLPPAQRPLARGEARSRARGHRSGADLVRALKPGSLVLVQNYSERDSQGRFRWVELMVIDESGRERSYRLTGKHLERANLEGLITTIHDRAAIVTSAGYLRQLAVEAGDDEDLAA